MEPCLFRHGKGGQMPRSGRDGTASMEPCLFRHGKDILDLQRRSIAVLRLQWSHVFSDMVRPNVPARTPFTYTAFNGAMSFQTW